MKVASPSQSANSMTGRGVGSAASSTGPLMFGPCPAHIGGNRRRAGGTTERRYLLHRFRCGILDMIERARTLSCEESVSTGLKGKTSVAYQRTRCDLVPIQLLEGAATPFRSLLCWGLFCSGSRGMSQHRSSRLRRRRFLRIVAGEHCDSGADPEVRGRRCRCC